MILPRYHENPGPDLCADITCTDVPFELVASGGAVSGGVSIVAAGASAIGHRARGAVAGTSYQFSDADIIPIIVATLATDGPLVATLQ